MKIKKFLVGMVGTNCYLAINENTKEAVIVDPGGFSEDMEACVKREGIKILAILLTHAHFDHIMGIDEVLEAFGKMPVYAHQDDLKMLETPELNLSVMMPYRFTGGEPIKGGQTLTLAGYGFQVLHTPGHTPGGVCYYVESEHVLFSGDTLFEQSVGRTDFPGGDMGVLLQSIREKLLALPEDTHVYPGHMGTTTIGEEKGFNPFL